MVDPVEITLRDVVCVRTPNGDLVFIANSSCTYGLAFAAALAAKA